MTDASEAWRDQGSSMGLSEETVRIELYCNYRDKQTWKQEAQENNFSSLSKYLHAMIGHGRASQKEGLQSRQETDTRVQELEAEIQRLEEELASQESTVLDASVIDTDLIASLLGEQYQTVEEILEDLTDNDELQANLKQPVEDALFDLAAENIAEYQEGWGWRLGGDL